MREQTIYIEPSAPPKPAYGQACNGCGVCCLGEPCPLGVLLSLRLRGRCAVLRWDSGSATYRCGALPALRGEVAPSWGWRRLHRYLVLRWISAGVGCDCRWETDVASSDPGEVLLQKEDHGPR